MISLIVACDEHNLIGKDGWMPWNLPEDLKHFKRVTLNKNILMGRKTFEGIGKPLPKRKTWVLTHQDISYPYENVEVIHDLQSLVSHFLESEEELVVCGGAQIYQLMLPYVQEMWISKVAGEYEGDTYFPKVNWLDYECADTVQYVGFVVNHYKRKKETL